MTYIKNEKNEFYCGTWCKKEIWMNGKTFAHNFPTDAEARKILFHLKDKLNNHSLKLYHE